MRADDVTKTEREVEASLKHLERGSIRSFREVNKRRR